MSPRHRLVGELQREREENARLRAEMDALRERIRIAKRGLRRSTKYEPWDDFEWTASIALDLRRTDYKRRPLPKSKLSKADERELMRALNVAPLPKRKAGR